MAIVPAKGNGVRIDVAASPTDMPAAEWELTLQPGDENDISRFTGGGYTDRVGGLDDGEFRVTQFHDVGTGTHVAYGIKQNASVLNARLYLSSPPTGPSHFFPSALVCTVRVTSRVRGVETVEWTAKNQGTFQLALT